MNESGEQFNLQTLSQLRTGFSDEENSIAVYCRDVELYYQIIDLQLGKSEHALRKTSITVPAGTIYGLLGPSGCGKTSLLKCIFGYIKPNAGIIKVFGFKPGEPGSGVPGSGLGYMPQDIALSDDLTIGEILTYFGRLALMDSKYLKSRVDYLISFLNLPPKYRIIGTLSGGEKRRTSVASALVHNPRLLILDEPTVGVDPLLRERIWDKLLILAKEEHVTTILTTHYIEEARRADNVGFMIKGQILTEGKPKELIKHLGLKTLEDVFFKLRLEHRDRDKSKEESNTEVDNFKIPTFTISEFESESDKIKRFPWMNTRRVVMGQTLSWLYILLTITRRLTIQMFRHYDFILNFFLFPILILMITCVTFGSTPFGLKLAVVDDENPPFLGEILVRNINPYVIDIQNYSDFDEAIEAAKRRDVWGVLHIKPNFSDSLMDRIFNYDDATNLTIDQSVIRLHGDMTDEIKRLTVELSLEGAFYYFIPDAVNELGYNPKLAQLPISLQTPIYGSFERADLLGIRDAVLPGFMMCLCYVIGYVFTSLALYFEKSGKILERTYAAGVTSTQLILGNLSSRIPFGAIQAAILLSMAIYIFDVPCNGSFSLALLLMVLQSFCGMLNGLLTSALIDELYLITGFTAFIFVFAFLISGVAWPIEAIPYYCRWLGDLLPPTKPAQSLTNILVRGHPFTSKSVYKGFIVTNFWIFLFTVLVLVCFKIKK